MLQSIPYFGVLAIESALNVIGVRLYEEPRYTVIDHVGDVEIRRYAPRAAAMVAFAPGAVERANAFRLLFDYIAGANDGNERIAMTAPVELRGERLAMTAPVQSSEGRMMFFLPADYGASSAPRPRDSRIKIVELPSEKIAALRFSGLGGDAPLRKSQLASGLMRSRWRAVGEPFMYYYDAPFTLPFLRRNEAAVVVEEAN